MVQEPAQFNNAVAMIQPLKADALPQPLQEMSQVSVAKPVSGSHEEWMQAAGIQPSDYSYVEFIISHESGWRPDAINPSSSSCGLVQALPCSKLGEDWSNPVKALSWGSQYATARYGSWAGAYNFWVAHNWW